MKPIEAGCTVLILHGNGLAAPTRRTEATVIRECTSEECKFRDKYAMLPPLLRDWIITSPLIESLCMMHGYPTPAYPEQWLMRIDGHEKKDDLDAALLEIHISELYATR